MQRFRFTAFGGDYTLMNVETGSENMDYSSLFLDTATGETVGNGYLIAEGETVELVYKVEITGETPPSSFGEAFQILQRLRSANIRGSFSVQERPGWTVTIEGY
ncbi:hypothetical protein LL252_06610 [Alcanivorax marinus]|uniref:Uncharacterized protein n=1 Tax=Alloalcanivorax marinus TaxID=1177169 RepID=A0A9Q3UL72_9GAMM|nr:hypothetical protein [Alloalcanivorax marinus]MCC4308240.1 hypothetical protein [Alloalcanivorax marinus]